MLHPIDAIVVDDAYKIMLLPNLMCKVFSDCLTTPLLEHARPA